MERYIYRYCNLSSPWLREIRDNALLKHDFLMCTLISNDFLITRTPGIIPAKKKMRREYFKMPRRDSSNCSQLSGYYVIQSRSLEYVYQALATISLCAATLFHHLISTFVTSSRTRGRVQFVCELATLANWRVRRYQRIMQLHVPYVCASTRACACYYMRHASQFAPHAICARVADDMCVPH